MQGFCPLLVGTNITMIVYNFIDMFLSSPYHLSPTLAKPYFYFKVVYEGYSFVAFKLD
jgi:hypothetical protein